MTYRTEFAKNPGSFRGVPFFTPSSEREGGRRGTVTEYPNSDAHRTQDLGLMVQRFMVTAWVIGPEYHITRDRLIAALEMPGAGPLVHRFHGRMDAKVEPGKTFRVTETQDEGGKAVFSIPFIRAVAAEPIYASNTAQAVRNAANKAKSFSLTAFVNQLDTSGFDEVRAEIFERMQDANNALTDVNNRVSGALATPTQIAGMIQTFGNNLATLIATPTRIGELADGLYAITEAIFGVIIQAGEALRADARLPFEQAAEAQVQARKVIGLNRQSRAQLAALLAGLKSTASDNDRVIFTLLAEAAAVEAARAAVDLPYDSRDTATETREDLTAALGALANSGDDDAYASLTDLRVELTRHLSRTAGELPQVITYTPARTLPSMLIAHLIYGDARRCEEIVARNGLRHPGFVPGAFPIKVLADA
jgi:prophage DNA circulation protein